MSSKNTPKKTIHNMTEKEFLMAVENVGLIGHREVVSDIYWTIQTRLKLGVSSDKPVGVKLLSGPTGSGKTFIARAISSVVHGLPEVSNSHVLRIDCSEYGLDHEVAKLIGAPPGYLGHRETTPILNQQKLNATTSEICPISFLLLDEFEKASDKFWKLFLSAFDTHGRITLGDNSIVLFARTFIFITSNIGMKRSNLGLLKPEYNNKINKKEVRKVIPIELINRIGIDNIHFVAQLSEAELRNVIIQEIRKIALALKTKNLYLANTDERVFELILNRSQWKIFGGRGIHNAVIDVIGKAITKLLIEVPITQTEYAGIKLTIDGENVVAEYASSIST